MLNNLLDFSNFRLIQTQTSRQATTSFPSSPFLPSSVIMDESLLRSHLECPICLNIPHRAKIFTCQHGHLICQPCFSKLPANPKVCPQVKKNVKRNIWISVQKNVFFSGPLQVQPPPSPQPRGRGTPGGSKLGRQLPKRNGRVPVRGMRGTNGFFYFL